MTSPESPKRRSRTEHREDEIVLPTGGSCMRPLIWPGGRLHVHRCRVDELLVGDIAVWFDGRTLLSHRVIELREGVFTTRGDWGRTSDIPAGAEQLLGRAVRFTIAGISYRIDSSIASAMGRMVAVSLGVKDGLRGTVRYLRGRL